MKIGVGRAGMAFVRVLQQRSFRRCGGLRATLFDSSHAYKPGDVHGVNTGEEEDEEDEDEEVEAEW